MAFDQAHADTLTELDALRRHVADAIDTIHGVVENGAWVTIPDGPLRELVGRYVGDAAAAIAAELGADDAREAAERLRGPGQLPIELRGPAT